MITAYIKFAFVCHVVGLATKSLYILIRICYTRISYVLAIDEEALESIILMNYYRFGSYEPSFRDTGCRGTDGIQGPLEYKTK